MIVVCSTPHCDTPVEMGRNGYPLAKCQDCFYGRRYVGAPVGPRVAPVDRLPCGHPATTDDDCGWCRR